MNKSMRLLSSEEFDSLVKIALDELPDEFADKMQNVEVVVEAGDFNDMKRHGYKGKGRLLGLYKGVPLKNRTVQYGMVLPDTITLFQRNIELTCYEQQLDIKAEIKHVVMHEIAHHFGISDERMLQLGIY